MAHWDRHTAQSPHAPQMPKQAPATKTAKAVHRASANATNDPPQTTSPDPRANRGGASFCFDSLSPFPAYSLDERSMR